MIDFFDIELVMIKLIFLAVFILVGCSIIYELSHSMFLAASYWLAFPLLALYFNLMPAYITVGIYLVLIIGFACRYVNWQIEINEIEEKQIIKKYDYRNARKR